MHTLHELEIDRQGHKSHILLSIQTNSDYVNAPRVALQLASTSSFESNLAPFKPCKVEWCRLQRFCYYPALLCMKTQLKLVLSPVLAYAGDRLRPSLECHSRLKVPSGPEAEVLVMQLFVRLLPGEFDDNCVFGWYQFSVSLKAVTLHSFLSSAESLTIS